ncbi:HNH endonuclease signature motif containing protein [Streptomyces sp. NPDC017943]|uniref:HNH endonuclease signature motif containing protein n=1 Tax=Streptomyces sp. NPDC017943 TaxID=3365019 RepID=UPI00379EB1B0
MDEATLARFTSKFETSAGGCWVWTAAIGNNGYGVFRFQGKAANAHRVSYLHYVGEVPEGLDLDHLCRVRHCVNPAHLEPVTRSVNLGRGIAPGRTQRLRTHCPKGHPYDAQNTRLYKGRRSCKACHREREAARRQTP